MREGEGEKEGVLDPLQAAGWEKRGKREAPAQLTASLALHYACHLLHKRVLPIYAISLVHCWKTFRLRKR